MHDIEKQFLSRGVMRGSLLMLRAADAIDMVRECRNKGVAVEDVEGFTLYEGGGTQPHMEHSLGLGRASTDMTDENNCWNQAEGFLSKYLKSDLWFDLTLPGPGSSAKCHCCGTLLHDHVGLTKYKQWKRLARLLLITFYVSSIVGCVLLFTLGVFESSGMLGVAVGITISLVLLGSEMAGK